MVLFAVVAAYQYHPYLPQRPVPVPVFPPPCKMPLVIILFANVNDIGRLSHVDFLNRFIYSKEGSGEMFNVGLDNRRGRDAGYGNNI